MYLKKRYSSFLSWLYPNSVSIVLFLKHTWFWSLSCHSSNRQVLCWLQKGVCWIFSYQIVWLNLVSTVSTSLSFVLLCSQLWFLHTQQNPYWRLVWGRSCLYLKYKKNLNGCFLKWNRKLLQWIKNIILILNLNLMMFSFFPVYI
jgi:hypothetical protein